MLLSLNVTNCLWCLNLAMTSWFHNTNLVLVEEKQELRVPCLSVYETLISMKLSIFDVQNCELCWLLVWTVLIHCSLKKNRIHTQMIQRLSLIN